MDSNARPEAYINNVVKVLGRAGKILMAAPVFK